MLKIINNLTPFFEDCYRRINVREYARLIKVSPPTASKMLESYNKKGLLLKETYKNYILYYANKESRLFIDLSRIYWRDKLKGIIQYIEDKSINPTIILFGSLSKAEVKPDSDIDLAIFGHKKALNLAPLEKKIKRKIQPYFFKTIKDIKSRELADNIINGYLLEGKLSL